MRPRALPRRSAAAFAVAAQPANPQNKQGLAIGFVLLRVESLAEEGKASIRPAAWPPDLSLSHAVRMRCCCLAPPFPACKGQIAPPACVIPVHLTPRFPLPRSTHSSKPWTDSTPTPSAASGTGSSNPAAAWQQQKPRVCGQTRRELHPASAQARLGAMCTACEAGRVGRRSPTNAGEALVCAAPQGSAQAAAPFALGATEPVIQAQSWRVLRVEGGQTRAADR